MKVEIDNFSGFCFGVINAIRLAESELKKNGSLYCLGDIVHNSMELERLKKMGLKFVSEEEYRDLKDCKVMIRAHGQPPGIYEYAKTNNIELIDATCPVVLNLQKSVKASFKKHISNNGQMVIFGKKGHAEVVALNGQINDNGIIVESIDDLDKIDFSRPVCLYSQTTRRVEDFYQIAGQVKANMNPGVPFEMKDTICRQVSNRVPHLKSFVVNYDLVIFVAGKKSSNGKYLFTICKEMNPNSYHVSCIPEIDPGWFKGIGSVGISGATSTPNWLMDEVATWIKETFD